MSEFPTSHNFDRDADFARMNGFGYGPSKDLGADPTISPEDQALLEAFRSDLLDATTGEVVDRPISGIPPVEESI